jgi:hypothetical protein
VITLILPEPADEVQSIRQALRARRKVMVAS